MNPEQKKTIRYIQTIDEIPSRFKWVRGFNGEAFVEQVKKEWQIIFDYLKKEGLVAKTIPPYWGKKTNNIFTTERAVSQIILYHYNQIKSGSPQYMSDTLCYVMEQMTFSNFSYEVITSILFMMLSDDALKQKPTFSSIKDRSAGSVILVINKILEEQKIKESLLCKYLKFEIRDAFAHFNVALYNEGSSLKQQGIICFNQQMEEKIKIPFIAFEDNERNNYDFYQREIVLLPSMLNIIYLVFIFKLLENFPSR